MQRTIKHFAATSFWECYKKLPVSTKKSADKAFALLKTDPRHPSLHLKKVEKYYSVRVGKKYRAVGMEVELGILWFWIGIHSEYDRIIAS